MVDSLASILPARAGPFGNPVGRTGQAGSNRADRPRIPCHQWIGGNQGHAFDRSLGDQKTVERILVQRRKVCDGQDMVGADRQLVVAVDPQFPAQERRVDSKIVSPRGC